MSHGGLDFLFEAVANSLEAGAKEITIEYKDHPGVTDITVTDDGEGFDCDVFSKGISTKGENRGNGLFLLKERADSCFIKRDSGYTTLSYRLKKEKGDLLSEVLPFIFSYADDKAVIKFVYYSKVINESICSVELKEEFGSLTSVKALSALKKRFSMFDL